MPEISFLVGMILGGLIGFLFQLTVNVEVVPPDGTEHKLPKWKRIVGILLEGRFQ